MAWSTMEEEMTVRDVLERQRRAIELDTLRQRVDPKEEGWAGVERQTPEGMSKWYGNRPSLEQQLANQAIEAPDLLTSILVPEPADIVGGFLAKPATTLLNRRLLSAIWPKTFSEITRAFPNKSLEVQFNPKMNWWSRFIRGADVGLQRVQDYVDDLARQYPGLRASELWDMSDKVLDIGQPIHWSTIKQLNPRLSTIDSIYADLFYNKMTSGQRRLMADLNMRPASKTRMGEYVGGMATEVTNPRYIPHERLIHGSQRTSPINNSLKEISRYMEDFVSKDTKKLLTELGYKQDQISDELLARIADIKLDPTGPRGKLEKALVNDLGKERLNRIWEATEYAIKNPESIPEDVAHILGVPISNQYRNALQQVGVSQTPPRKPVALTPTHVMKRNTERLEYEKIYPKD